ncbi:hypothetical protein [Actinoplanes teichomyceticus]|uniref:Uncharacterized protein n=1 Tax=Actinoplanes teichomyceticus TaxID=1867 RepID=A0A561WBB3_ACTTI|nr:hypothetical protein [Actinoplanes teichomyceticus]TWG21157.1 hypothetical protein FHX34_103687 [Actinoplanes teichomyceticus]GIF14979.1 hypothetical protein Ate01nite_50110 [Actinoplanes teichomyceticus]
MSRTDDFPTVAASRSGQRAVTFIPPATWARPPSAPAGRSLLSYLVMPRPGDAVKALLMPLAFGLGVLAEGGASRDTVLRALIGLVVLELLVYPARYQWNDIRGFAADQRHPGRARRGRLPGPPQLARERVTASTVVATARLGVAVGVALLPGLRLGGTVLAMIAGVFGVAVAYEALRSAATGRGSGGTPRVTPVLVSLWLTVGAGYVVRGMTGLAMAVDLGDRPGLALAAAVTLWAYGIAFVTSRWAVESLAFARLDGGRVSWTADGSLAREHMLALTRWLPATVTPGRSPARWAALRGRTPATAPWNLALVLAGAGAAVTGLLLTTPVHEPGAPVLGALAGGVATLVVILLPGRRTVAVPLGAAAVLAATLAGPARAPVAACLPWTAVLLAYLHFSAQSLDSLSHPRRAIREPLMRALAPAARIAVGHDTWRLLTAQSQRPARG